MRDVLTIPFSAEEMIIIASDNSGAIGMKEGDSVQVSYKTVGYYSFRTAVMECMSAGGHPFAVILQNFCGEAAWEPLLKGINQGLAELGIDDINTTGSTESNFAMTQSAVGITVLGKKKSSTELDTELSRIAVIGYPLVGDEVIEREHQIAPLNIFADFCAIESVVIMPVGSKGILHELNQLFPKGNLTEANLDTDLDLQKSSGPSTCFIVAYPSRIQSELAWIAGRHFHEIRRLE
ncbi:MAG TPA: ATP-binding protein [Bacillus bacterium]|nr:ATP-binding protein [Bacillus sp. (in: firmicutes)]